MMGVDHRHLTWWEYQALLATWNERHSDSGPIPPPLDPDKARAAMAAVSVI